MFLYDEINIWASIENENMVIFHICAKKIRSYGIENQSNFIFLELSGDSYLCRLEWAFIVWMHDLLVFLFLVKCLWLFHLCKNDNFPLIHRLVYSIPLNTWHLWIEFNFNTLSLRVKLFTLISNHNESYIYMTFKIVLLTGKYI
jgi:hypothetical protein